MNAPAALRAPLPARIALVTVIVLSIPIAVYGLGFGFIDSPNDFRTRLSTLPWFAWPHFIGGGVALLLGGFQFSARLRSRRPALHRLLGRIYLLAVLAAGLGGLGIATIAHGGASARIGFGLLALLWLGSGLAAWRAIVAGDIEAHRRWMTRNFALTFAAVTLRVDLVLLQNAFGLGFDDAYRTVAWFAWVPNLVIAEWWLLGVASRTARRLGQP